MLEMVCAPRAARRKVRHAQKATLMLMNNASGTPPYAMSTLYGVAASMRRRNAALRHASAAHNRMPQEYIEIQRHTRVERRRAGVRKTAHPT